MAEHARIAGGRVEQPAEHLQRCRLARAVRPQEADDLTLGDLERDIPNRLDRREAPRKQRAQGRRQPFLAFRKTLDRPRTRIGGSAPGANMRVDCKAFGPRIEPV